MAVAAVESDLPGRGNSRRRRDIMVDGKNRRQNGVWQKDGKRVFLGWPVWVGQP